MLAEIGDTRTAGRRRDRAWWLISRRERGRMEPMTIRLGGREALAVFSHEEEAGLFLWSLGAAGGGWGVRESRRGEIASVLCGPCGDVETVALDPLPEMAADGTATLVCLNRADFLRRLMPGAGLPDPFPAAAPPARGSGGASARRP